MRDSIEFATFALNKRTTLATFYLIISFLLCHSNEHQFGNFFYSRKMSKSNKSFFLRWRGEKLFVRLLRCLRLFVNLFFFAVLETQRAFVCFLIFIQRLQWLKIMQHTFLLSSIFGAKNLRLFHFFCSMKTQLSTSCFINFSVL